MFFTGSQFEFENLPNDGEGFDGMIQKYVIAIAGANIDLSKPIYKIFPIERFMELILMKRIAFTHPEKWDDPAEYSYIVRHQSSDGVPVFKDKGFDLFGQCWSMNKSCDGLWRTYSNNKQKLAVQVRTTVGALVKAYAEKDKDALSHLFCGKVVYENTEELKRRGAITEPSSLVEDLDSLFYKRRDFEYEQEVRLVATISQRSLKMFENASRLKTCQYALFCFNDLNWIDGCVVSPWASFMEIAMVKELAKFGGIDPACAMKSDLYESWRWKS